MSKQERYFLFAINYEVGEFMFTEHYVTQAANRNDAEMRVAHGLKTWYDDDGVEPNDNGYHDTGDGLLYAGYVEHETSKEFFDKCSAHMMLPWFGDDYQPNLKDMAVKAIREAS